VLIQLGSILAIMLLYRKKIIDIISGACCRAMRRCHFAFAINRRHDSRAAGGRVLSGFVKRVLYEKVLQVFRGPRVHSWRESVMLRGSKAECVPVFRWCGMRNARRCRGRSASGCVRCWPSSPACRVRARRSSAGWRGPRPARRRRVFVFLAMPTMTAAFAHDLFEHRHELSSGRALDIGVGLVAAFLASLAVITPFLAVS